MTPASASSYAYQAFISYSHAADGRFAPALHAGLQQFARPWNRLRAIRVFRDQSGLAVTPDLWRSIASAMDSSEYFLLLASPQAAHSHWVEQEVRHWLSQPRANRLLIVVTDGTIEWDADLRRPDPRRTDVLPPSLCDTAAEPLWLDLRWARASEDLSLHNPRWRDALASLSSTIRGIPKDQLIGEDVRQHARATRLRRAAIAGLTALTLALGIVAAVAVQQRDLAREQARIARARQLAAQAELIRSQQPWRLPLALLMAVEATRAHADSIEAQQTLQSVLSLFPTPTATLTHDAAVAFADVTDDRQFVATAGTDAALWRVSDRTRIASLAGAHRHAVFSPDGQLIAGCCEEVSVWTSAGSRTLRLTAGDLGGQPETVAFSPDSRLLAVAVRGPAPSVSILDLRTSQRLFQHRTSSSEHAPTVAFSPEGDLAVAGLGSIETFSRGTWLPKRRLTPGSGPVHRIAFRADGRYLASSSTGIVTVFNLQTGEQAARLDVFGDGPGQTMDLTFSRNGQYLAAVGELNTGAIWSVSEWREIVAVRHGELQTIASLSFGASTNEAVSCSWEGDCIGWSLATGQKVHHFAHQHVYAVDDRRKRSIAMGTFAGTTSLFLTAGADGSARLWDLASASEIDRAPCGGEVVVRTFGPPERYWNRDGPGSGLTLVPDGCAVAGPGNVNVSDAVSAPIIVPLSATRMLRVDEPGALSVSRLPDASPAWAASLHAVAALSISGDGQRVAAADEANGTTIFVWDSASGTRVFEQRVDEKIGGIVFDPSARYLTAVLGKHSIVPSGLPQGVGLKVWDISSAREVVSVPEADKLVAFAFSRDGSQLAVVDQVGALVVWDLGSGRSRRTVAAEAGPVGFSESGLWVATGSRAIRIFETATLRAVAHLDVRGDARRIAFQSEDRILRVDAFPPGDTRGTTLLRHWMPDDVRADACRVMPEAAAVSQWMQLFPDAAVPAPCAP